MHILKIKTKITDLSLEKVSPGMGKPRPVTDLLCVPQKPQTIIKKIINFCSSSTKF